MSAGKTLLVTGGGRGIGAETAVLAAQDGWRVAVNFTSNEGAAQSVADRIIAAGGDAFVVKADVGVEADVVAMFAAIDQRWGHLDGLVNNAGVVDRKARLDEMSGDRMDRMFRINVVGSLLCAREAVKRMSTKHGGRGGAIVNVSSVAAVLGSPGEYVDYAAAKGAIDTFTVGLAREVAEEKIRVNVVRPGTIATEIHASGGQPDRAQRVASAIPMKRPGEPREIAEAIIWLLSDKASYTTGAILDVSGGR
jgi:NAD(P)-dependent dehydrogenase (short-subunit alcohol dehydrogenase family)